MSHVGHGYINKLSEHWKNIQLRVHIHDTENFNAEYNFIYYDPILWTTFSIACGQVTAHPKQISIPQIFLQLSPL
jgi:hypothetical protein